MDLPIQKRPCWVEIDTHAFEHNFQVLAAACSRGAVDSASLRPQLDTSRTAEPPELLAIVKANAYGHGLALCAPAAVHAGARWLGVTCVEEGATARALCPYSEAGPEILVISGPFPGQGAATIAHRLTSVVWEPWHLDELEAAAQSANCPPQSVPVHLEVDTGMSRQGVAISQLEALLARFKADGPLKLDGLMTHLFAADETGGEVTREQLQLMSAALERVLAAGLRPSWLNVGNSAALLAGEVPPGLHLLAAKAGIRAMLRPMLRPGLALYGLTPEFVPDEPDGVAALRRDLKPVLTWKTQVVSVRSAEAGQVVGYNGTFVATEPMRLALLAAGYGDGLKRALSNRGSVLVGGRRCPIAGRISMDQTVVDVTEVPGIAPGDEVVLLGRQGDERISAEEHAKLADTIPWEIFTSIGERVERRAV